MKHKMGPHDDSLEWLLEPDPVNPGIRLLALTQLMDLPPGDAEVVASRQAVSSTGPVPAILGRQSPEGYWVQPGPGYYPKYRGSVWQVIFLAQLGADGKDPRVGSACEYLLTNSRSQNGGFSYTGTSSGMIHCLQGNLIASLLDLGWLGDERLDSAIDWLARSITGEGIAPSQERTAEIRYYRSGNSAPGFVCSANNHLPCAWGAVKAMLALGKIPEPERTPVVRRAIAQGIAFLLSHDPSVADYPMGYSTKPSRSWFRFGYPIAYVTDVLQILEALTALGCGSDPRLEAALDLVLGKRDAHGRWGLEYTYNGKSWVDVERKGEPSKWVTLRALRVLRRAQRLPVLGIGP
jgi:hypothetical protein